MDSANAETKLMAAESTAVLDGRERKWEPGIIARFPLVGLGALLSSILCKRHLSSRVINGALSNMRHPRRHGGRDWNRPH